MRDAVGTVHVTSKGQLNAASIDGIVGNYGVNPARVTYDDTSAIRGVGIGRF